MTPRVVFRNTQRAPAQRVTRVIIGDVYHGSSRLTEPLNDYDTESGVGQRLHFRDLVDEVPVRYLIEDEVMKDIIADENEMLDRKRQRHGFGSPNHQSARGNPNNPIHHDIHPTIAHRASTFPRTQSPRQRTSTKVPRPSTFTYDQREPQEEETYYNVHRGRSGVSNRACPMVYTVPSPPAPPPRRRPTTGGHYSNHQHRTDKYTPTVESITDPTSEPWETSHDPRSVEIEDTTDQTSELSETSYDYSADEGFPRFVSLSNKTPKESMRPGQGKPRPRKARDTPKRNPNTWDREENVKASIESDFRECHRLIGKVIRQALQLNEEPLLDWCLERVYFDQTRRDKDHPRGGWREVPRVLDSLPGSRPRGLMGALSRVLVPVLQVSLPLRSLKAWHKGALRNMEDILKTPARRQENEILSKIPGKSIVPMMALDYRLGDQAASGWVEATCVLLPGNADPDNPGQYTPEMIDRGSVAEVREWSGLALQGKLEYEKQCHSAACQQLDGDEPGAGAEERSVRGNRAPRYRQPGARPRGTGGDKQARRQPTELGPEHPGQPQFHEHAPHHGQPRYQRPQSYQEAQWDYAQQWRRGPQWNYGQRWPVYT